MSGKEAPATAAVSSSSSSSRGVVADTHLSKSPKKVGFERGSQCVPNFSPWAPWLKNNEYKKRTSKQEGSSNSMRGWKSGAK